MRPYRITTDLEGVLSLPPVFRRDGVALSADDSLTVAEVYQQWLLLAVDLGYLRPETMLRDGHRLWVDMTHADVLDLNNAFAECLAAVRRQTFRGFKGLCARISAHLYHIVAEDVALVQSGDVFAARRLVQLFSYTSRLTLRDIDLTQQQLDEYKAIEAGLPASYDPDLVASLNRIVRGWLGPYCPTALVPQHGPGGVARHGRCSLETKYNDLTSDQRLEYAFGDPYWVSAESPDLLDRTSQTIFVPKSYKSFRTISMEPATLQYFQQGVWKALDRVVACSRYLKARLDFHDQERNQRLAREGSLLRNYATLDLSAASDSVGYDLVKGVFRGTWLPRYFLATRSTHTLLPDGSRIPLRKFAPMGSALCFPIETILFAAICELVAREYRSRRDYSVFGDDIIVPTALAERTVAVLAALGFTVNTAKSFVDDTCWFRESCGGEYCDGFDVTPMRVSRKFASTDTTIQLTKLMDMSNEAYKRGFRNLRNYFLRKMRERSFVPFFSPSATLGDNYSNYHTKTRWNVDLQRLEVQVTQPVSRVPVATRESQDEVLRYRHWFESTLERSSLGLGFESVICKPTVRLCSVWREKPYQVQDQDMIDSLLRKYAVE